MKRPLERIRLRKRWRLKAKTGWQASLRTVNQCVNVSKQISLILSRKRSGTYILASSIALQILGWNNFQGISIRAYPRFIINALCSPVMAFFTLTLSIISPWGRRSHARFAFPSFQRGFLFELSSPGQVWAPTTGAGILRDRDLWTYLCWIITQERIFYIVMD